MVDLRENATWFVYLHVNKSNNKTYVGITQNPRKRFSGGSGYHDQVFGQEIKKYGWDAFEHIIFASHLTKNEARDMECTLIAKLRTNEKEYGYNLRNGGDVRNIEVCKFDFQGNLLDRYGSLTEAAASMNKNNITNIMECCKGTISQAYGYIWKYASDCSNTRATQEIIKADKRFFKYYPVYQFDLDCNYISSYPSGIEASKATGSSVNSIVNCCTSTLLKTNGYRWAFQKDVPDVNNYHVRPKHGNRFTMRAVVQLDKAGDYIATYESSAEAARRTGLSANNIYQCCIHEKKSHKGTYWEFLENYKKCTNTITN